MLSLNMVIALIVSTALVGVGFFVARDEPIKAWLRSVGANLSARSPIVSVRYVGEVDGDDTRTDTRTTGQYRYAPDTDAENDDTENEAVPYHSAPAVDSDGDLIAHLAGLQYSNGKWRMSANAICSAVGGSRAEVLEQVRKVRASDEPVVSKEPQFVKVGEREQYQRVGVKPIR